MYVRYYGFSEYPFSVTPDPAFLYLGTGHREALGHLLYGTGEHGGFVALIGEVGTGKTTLIRALVDNEHPDLDIALCWNPHLEVKEFVATICDELGADYNPDTDVSLKDLVDRLNQHLLATHADNRRTVLIIDEAQNLSSGVLEQLRLLTNLETHKHKLLRIILVGQPELDELLSRHDLRQLAQRITARSWLAPLPRAETRAYVQHRLKLAGGSAHLFTPAALFWLHWRTGGIPRLINMVCERALMGGYAYAKSRIRLIMLWRAGAETLPRRRRAATLRYGAPALALLLVAAVGVLAWYPGIRLSRAAEWIQQSRAALVATDAGEAEAATEQAADSDTGGATDKQASSDARPADVADTEAESDTTETDADKPETEAKADNAADASDDGDAAEVAANDQAATELGQAREQSRDASADTPAQGFPPGDADISQLLRLWGVFGSRVHSGCKALRVGDLRCLADRGNFATVERFNRPALLTVQRDGRRQTILLSALDGDHATLVGADGTRRVERDTLTRLWTGQFEIIWRADSGVGLIPPGAVGNAVVWLRQRLTRASGKNPDTELGPPSPVYDNNLKAQLKSFQRAHGLEADGMAGPRTQMMLNGAVATPGSPALKAVNE